MKDNGDGKTKNIIFDKALVDTMIKVFPLPPDCTQSLKFEKDRSIQLKRSLKQKIIRMLKNLFNKKRTLDEIITKRTFINPNKDI